MATARFHQHIAVPHCYFGPTPPYPLWAGRNPNPLLTMSQQPDPDPSIRQLLPLQQSRISPNPKHSELADLLLLQPPTYAAAHRSERALRCGGHGRIIRRQSNVAHLQQEGTSLFCGHRYCLLIGRLNLGRGSRHVGRIAARKQLDCCTCWGATKCKSCGRLSVSGNHDGCAQNDTCRAASHRTRSAAAHAATGKSRSGSALA